MIVGSLAIYHEDPTGTAAKLLALAVPGARQNCAQAVQSNGSWSETSDYWYLSNDKILTKRLMPLGISELKVTHRLLPRF